MLRFAQQDISLSGSRRRGATHHRGLRFLLRHHVHLLTTLALLFILQSGLVPFDFRFTEAGRMVESSTTSGSLPDIVANLFLYVPLGVCVHWSLARIARGASAVFILTVFLGGVLSGAIEWVQAYSPSRVCSVVDLTANTIGAALGACLSSTARWVVPRLIGVALFEVRERPSAAVLKAYCGLLIVAAAIPFSFSFDRTGLSQAVKASVFVPFSLSSAQRAAREQAEAMHDARAMALGRLEQMRRWARWAAELASFAVCGWLTQAVLRRDYNFGSGGAAALTCWLCGFLAVALSVLQLPIVSRGCDVTDVLFRWVGIAVGLIPAALRSSPAASSPRHTPLQAAGTGVGRAAGAALVAYILYTGLTPFEFAPPEDGVWGPLSAAAFLPFMAYFDTRVDLMMTDAIEKFAVYALLAGSLHLSLKSFAGRALGSRLVSTTAVGVALATLIEAAQMFLPVRVVSLTDPLIAAAASITGTVLADHAARFYGWAMTREVLGPDERFVRGARALSLTDEILATLGEPDPRAPTETPPAPVPKA
jgi:VanZ family protein